MAAGFRIRRIKSDQSIGDRLKRARVRRKISVAEAEEATRIRAKFILALESDSWDQIPSEVYGRGYLEAYAEYLKLPVDEIMDSYDRSRSTYARLCQEQQVELAPQSSVRIPKVVFTPRFLLIAVLSLGIAGFAGVVGKQIARFNSAPYLKLQLASTAEASSGEGADLVVRTSSVEIAGKTAIGANVIINGQRVAVEDNGNFVTHVPVNQGVNAITVKASFNGKETEEVRTIVVK